jgi:hypothetical protein
MSRCATTQRANSKLGVLDVGKDFGEVRSDALLGTPRPKIGQR